MGVSTGVFRVGHRQTVGDRWTSPSVPLWNCRRRLSGAVLFCARDGAGHPPHTPIGSLFCWGYPSLGVDDPFFWDWRHWWPFMGAFAWSGQLLIGANYADEGKMASTTFRT